MSVVFYFLKVNKKTFPNFGKVYTAIMQKNNYFKIAQASLIRFIASINSSSDAA